jgi:putative flippase GtrA
VLVLRQFVLFSLVGVIGFVVDAATVSLLVQLLHANPYAARLVSFLLAATCTWALNRRVTFSAAQTGRARSQWVRFVGANAFGAIVNFGTYAWLISVYATARHYPALAVAGGSIAGLFINFTASKAFVFRTT